MNAIICKCGKGYASEYDNLCKFCREHLVSRSVAKKIGVKYRSDGMTVERYIKANKAK